MVSWEDTDCAECYYNIDDECRRHPPLIRAFTTGTYTDYPCVLDCTDEYTKACAEFKWSPARRVKNEQNKNKR